MSGSPSKPRARDGAELAAIVKPFGDVDPSNRRSRVQYVANMQALGQWRRGETPGELAAEWGIRKNQVEKDASDASLLLDLLGDREALLQRVMVRLDGIAFNGAEETRDVIASLRLMLEAAGLLKQHHVVETQSMDSSEMHRRMVVVFRNPDPVTRAALEEAGWRYEPAIETEGSES